MKKMIVDENYDLPTSEEHGNVLVWVISELAATAPLWDDTEEQAQSLVILEGPAWARVLELHDPTYYGVPDTLPGGLYVFDVTVDYTVNRYGDEDDVRVTVHRYVRQHAPTRQRLIDSAFEEFLGVLA